MDRSLETSDDNKRKVDWENVLLYDDDTTTNKEKHQTMQVIIYMLHWFRIQQMEDYDCRIDFSVVEKA